jgi:hypothetical protein
MQATLLYVGAAVIFLWGLGHLIPTRGIVTGFGALSADNRRIITMEWLAEGLMLCFLGVLVGVTAWVLGADQPATSLVARMSAAMLLVMALLSSLTGARTSVLPMKLCPVVKSAVAVVFVAGTLA